MKTHDSITAGPPSHRCPFCGVDEPSGHDYSARCLFCGGFFSEGLLEALRRMSELPDIITRQPAGAADRS
jgi:hypothetical protein